MISHDITPDKLLAALDTFRNDQELTKGQAIRVLVTDMLMQLGYLAPAIHEGAPAEDPVYRSSNGDDWLLERDSAGSISVIHRANASSGGMETTTSVAQFLAQNEDGPEGMAVKAALNPAAGHVAI